MDTLDRPPSPPQTGLAAALRRASAFSLPAALAVAVAAALLLRPAYPPPVFRVGAQPWAGFAPAYLARATGDWPRDLIRVVELPTDAEVVRALRSGVLEGACITLDGALRAQSAGVELRILAVADFSEGGDAVLAVRGHELRTTAGLRGRRVAVERHGVGSLVLGRALRAAGLRLGDVRLVNADIPDHAQLVAEGRVDAVVTYSPFKERIVQAGGRVLYDSAQGPGQVVDVLVVRAEALLQSPRAVRAAAEGWLRAAEGLKGGGGVPDEIAAAMGMTPDELAAAMKSIRVPDRGENHALLVGPLPRLAPAARSIAEDLRALGLVAAPTAPDRLFLAPAEAEVLSW